MKMTQTRGLVSGYLFIAALGMATLNVDSCFAVWMDGFSHRCPIVVGGTTTNELSNYQVCVSNVAYKTSMQTDFSDIRFTDSDGSSLLDHWLEVKTDSSSATFWVKVPLIPVAPGTTKIYMYYGNSGAVDASSVSSTFITNIANVVASWNFDDGSGTSAADSSGNENTGTLIDTPTWVDGRFKKAVRFAGTNYVDCGSKDSLIVTTNAFTFEAWANTDVSPAIGRYTYYLVGKPGWHMGLNLATKVGGADGNNYWSIDAYNNANEYKSTYGEWWKPVSTGVWQYVVGTYDSTNISIYVDGVLQIYYGSPTCRPMRGYGPQTYIGTPTGYSGFFQGMIDEVKIYNRNLSATEISTLYSNYGYTTTNYPGWVLVRKFAWPEPSVEAPGLEEVSGTLIMIE